MTDKSRQQLPWRATDPGPRPGDFPLGSVESRAAARAEIERKKRDQNEYWSDFESVGTELPGIRVNIVHIGHNGKDSLPSAWRSDWDGGVTEFVHTAG